MGVNINLLKDAKLVRIANAAAAAQTEITSSVVDMQGYDSVMFVAALGDVTATSVLTLTAKTNTANSTSSPTPTTLASPATYTAAASDADNKLMALDLQKVRERYVFATLTRTTANAVVDGIFAILYNKQDRPLVSQDSTVLVTQSVNDPSA